MSEFVREQLMQLNRLYKEGNERYYETAMKLGVSSSALMILYGLCHAGRPCTQKELCDTWYLKKQTLHSALNQLLKSGDIYIEPSPNNWRIKLLVLTPKGETLCKKSAIPFLQAEERAFERLTPKERSTLLKLTFKHSRYVKEEVEILTSDSHKHFNIKYLEEINMIIRQEIPNDYGKIYDLIKLAFETAEHSDGNEHDLANALRTSDVFVPELSLVAEIDGQIAGHILFTEGKVGDDTVLILAPLSISPNYQKQGIGTALIAEAHNIAKTMGYQYSLVLGSEKYYPRSGYLPAEQFGIEVPEGIPSANFMAIKLTENTSPISGVVTYAKEFGM